MPLVRRGLEAGRHRRRWLDLLQRPGRVGGVLVGQGRLVRGDRLEQEGLLVGRGLGRGLGLGRFQSRLRPALI